MAEKLYGKKLKYKGAGKGDKRRPIFITQEQYAKNWEKAFGRTNRGNKTKTSKA